MHAPWQEAAVIFTNIRWTHTGGLKVMLSPENILGLTNARLELKLEHTIRSICSIQLVPKRPAQRQEVILYSGRLFGTPLHVRKQHSGSSLIAVFLTTAHKGQINLGGRCWQLQRMCSSQCFPCWRHAPAAELRLFGLCGTTRDAQWERGVKRRWLSSGDRKSRIYSSTSKGGEWKSDVLSQKAGELPFAKADTLVIHLKR